MALWIEVTDNEYVDFHKKMMVNMENFVCVLDDKPGTVLRADDGTYFYVKETYEQIREKINQTANVL